MKLNVLLFGYAADLVGQRVLSLDVESQFTTGELRQLLDSRFVGLMKLKTYSIAVNKEYAIGEIELKENDEVAIIPPVSGG